jgi:hypothetical protein
MASAGSPLKRNISYDDEHIEAETERKKHKHSVLQVGEGGHAESPADVVMEENEQNH